MTNILLLETHLIDIYSILYYVNTFIWRPPLRFQMIRNKIDESNQMFWEWILLIPLSIFRLGKANIFRLDEANVIAGQIVK